MEQRFGDMCGRCPRISRLNESRHPHHYPGILFGTSQKRFLNMFISVFLCDARHIKGSALLMFCCFPFPFQNIPLEQSES
jgi:hypothetical protein